MEEEEEEDHESEQVSDHFICTVCLDLPYKPVVLVCGHVTCFWCCYRSMNMRDQSLCPLCRHPYRHFPAICQMLDIFLKKLYPVPYGRRKKQTLDDKQQGLLWFAPDEEPSLLSIADVLCSACKQLLFHPVVLNCGHVYCETCITIPEDGVIICQICQSQHPSGFPKVCKELDYVLEEQFSSKYALRKDSTQLFQEQIQNRSLFKKADKEGCKLPYPPAENFLRWWTVHGSKFHPGIGCDMCGMLPIIGDRYNCKDCKEKRGYDLCGDCHKTGTKLPGRFNQKHTSQHRFDLVKAVINQDVIYRLLSGQLAVVSAARNSSNRTPQFASSPLGGGGGGSGGSVGGDDGVGGVQAELVIDSRGGQSGNQTAL